MSRIGKRPISIPKGVEIKITENKIIVKGPNGQLEQLLPLPVKVVEENNELKVSVENPLEKKQRSLWGTFQRLISNMVQGVTKKFEKSLELVGVGFRASVSDNKLILNIGFSHPQEFLIPDGIEAKVEKNIIHLNGIDKQLVGETAARIRRLRKPEPYKGKGIRYLGEQIRRKVGKKAAAASG